MMFGDSPFDGSSNTEWQQMTTTLDVLYPSSIYISEEEDYQTERDFLEALFQKNPEKRIGCHPGQEEDIKSHHFFQTIDWNKLESLEVEPPFRPVIIILRKKNEYFENIFF